MDFIGCWSESSRTKLWKRLVGANENENRCNWGHGRLFHNYFQLYVLHIYKKSSLFGVPLNLITLFVGYGGLALSIEGPSKVDIQTEDMDDGTCGVSYCPTEPGTYVVSIRFAEEHVPGKNWTAFNIYNMLSI